MTGAPRIARVSRIDARIAPGRWEWAEREAEAITRHWSQRLARQPRMFDGRVLVVSRWAIVGEVLESTYLETDFSTFLAWREWGFPDRGRANGFAAGALRSADGAFLLGVMAGHTANAGRIYFPCGTPDPHDVTEDGRVDLAGSVFRELEEETGLAGDDVGPADHWVIVEEGATLAALLPLTIDLPAPEARDLILSRMEASGADELDDIHIVRTAHDLVPGRMPDFVLTYLRAAFAGQAG